MIEIKFYKGKSTIYSKLVRLVQYLTNDKYWKYSHCEIVIDGVWYSSSSMDGGVKIREIKEKVDNWETIYLELSIEEVESIKRMFESNINAKYDYLGISLYQLLPFNIEDEDKFFCSEICIKALNEIIPFKNPPAWYSPAKFIKELYEIKYNMLRDIP